MSTSRKATKKKTNLKSEFLTELVECYTYWSDQPEQEAQEYAAAYEKLINAFTTPEEEGN